MSFKYAKFPPPYKPTAYVPWLRRFTDERSYEREATRSLYRRVRTFWDGIDDPKDIVGKALTKHIGERYPERYDEALIAILEYLVFSEEIFSELVGEAEWGTLTLQEGVELRSLLRAQEHFFAHKKQIISLYIQTVKDVFDLLLSKAPPEANASLFSVPLYTFVDVNDTLERMFYRLIEPEVMQAGILLPLKKILYHNICRISGADPNAENPRLVYPKQKNLPPQEAIAGYLHDTPLSDLLLATVPLDVPLETFFSHTWIVAGSGQGKTQFLQNLILHFLDHDDQPSLVVVDSQGDMIRKLSHLPMGGRCILISPKDIERPPAINIFDMGGRMEDYDPVIREQVVAGAIQTLEYLFSDVVGASLTAKQNVFFRFISRLLISLPETLGRNATLIDMLNIMDDLEPYREAIQKLPDIQKKFFLTDFAGKGFTPTKEQIKYRLNGILENPTLERLFTAPHTRLDIFTELNQGSVILVDTSKEFLKGASSHFGRIFISLILKNILERAAIDEDLRHPTFLIVDEAAEYFDTNVDDLLTQARKYHCGVVMAHQYLEQASGQLRASLSSNTAIKMAGGVSTSDARNLAPDMRTSPEFIASQPKLHFATYIRGVTPQAISVPVEYGKLEGRDMMDDQEYARFIEANGLRVSTAPSGEQPDTQRPASDGEPVEKHTGAGIATSPSPLGRNPPASFERTSREPLRQGRDVAVDVAGKAEGRSSSTLPETQPGRAAKKISQKPTGPFVTDVDIFGD